MVDGVSCAMGFMRADSVARKETLDAAIRCGLGLEILHSLRRGNDSTTIWFSLGGRYGLPQTTVLFACVLEYARELGVFLNCAPSRSAQISKNLLRALWTFANAASRASQGREFPEQRIEQFGNVMSELSQTRASIAAAVKASTQFNAFPLALNIPSRVGRLRGYGNAIVPAQAAAFVQAYMSVR
jgi:hypothetical protein